MSFQGYATIHGTAATLRTITRGSYVPATGSASETVATTNLAGVLEEYAADELNDQILLGDKRFLVAAGAVSAIPNPDDRLVIGSRTYRIVSVTKHQATSLNVLYSLQLRGGP